MIDELTRLNNEVYRLLSELDKYSASMGDEMRDEMRAVILHLYKSEADLLLKKLEISVATENFEYDRQMEYLVPQRWRTRFFRRRKQNSVADLIEDGVRSRLEAMLRQMQEDLSRTDAQNGCADEAQEEAESVVDVSPGTGEEISWYGTQPRAEENAEQPEKVAVADAQSEKTGKSKRGRHKKENSAEMASADFEQLSLSLGELSEEESEDESAAAGE